jgi:hypothetical protein
MKKAYLAAGAALGAVVALFGTAWAGHGKAGLWEIRMQNTVSGIPGMQRAAGEHVGRHCMTPTEAGQDHPDFAKNAGCKLENMKSSAQGFSADMVCTGPMVSKGHIEMAFLSPEHYTVTQNIAGTMDGKPINTVMKIDAKWLSADCGATKK